MGVQRQQKAVYKRATRFFEKRSNVGVSEEGGGSGDASMITTPHPLSKIYSIAGAFRCRQNQQLGNKRTTPQPHMTGAAGVAGRPTLWTREGEKIGLAGFEGNECCIHALLSTYLSRAAELKMQAGFPSPVELLCSTLRLGRCGGTISIYLHLDMGYQVRAVACPVISSSGSSELLIVHAR